MSIVRARIEALERRVERLLCLIDKANAQLDGLRDRESRRAVRLWQRRLALKILSSEAVGAGSRS